MNSARVLPKRLEGRHVLMGLGVFFGVMFAANGVFLYYAVGTFNGFETRDAYRRGLEYNTRIASDAAQAQLGWQPDVRYDAGSQSLVLHVHDQAQRPLAGLGIRGEIRRPATDSEDRNVVLTEVAPGQYETSIDLDPGQWVLIASLSRSGGEHVSYRFKQRLWVREDR